MYGDFSQDQVSYDLIFSCHLPHDSTTTTFRPSPNFSLLSPLAGNGPSALREGLSHHLLGTEPQQTLQAEALVSYAIRNGTFA